MSIVQINCTILFNKHAKCDMMIQKTLIYDPIIVANV